MASSVALSLELGIMELLDWVYGAIDTISVDGLGAGVDILYTDDGQVRHDLETILRLIESIAPDAEFRAVKVHVGAFGMDGSVYWSTLTYGELFGKAIEHAESNPTRRVILYMNAIIPESETAFVEAILEHHHGQNLLVVHPAARTHGGVVSKNYGPTTSYAISVGVHDRSGRAITEHCEACAHLRPGETTAGIHRSAVAIANVWAEGMSASDVRSNLSSMLPRMRTICDVNK